MLREARDEAVRQEELFETEAAEVTKTVQECTEEGDLLQAVGTREVVSQCSNCQGRLLLLRKLTGNRKCCYVCGQEGHLKQDCPNKLRKNLPNRQSL